MARISTNSPRKTRKGSTSFKAFQESLREIRQMQKETARRMEETERIFREMTAETDRRREETDRQMKETDRRMKETDRQMKETDRQMKETDRRMDRRIEETAQQMKETDRRIEETAQQMKETDRQMDRRREESDRRMEESRRNMEKIIGKLGNRFGELVEHLVAPNINEKFNALGYHFDGFFNNGKISGPGGTSAEIDLLLTNGEFSIAIEIKAKPNEEDVKDHIRRLEILRKHMDKLRDSRKLRGAIAGGIMSNELQNFAFKTGFYVIKQSGDTVEINIPPNFIPREW